MKTIAQTLRELKSLDLSESMLKDIELMEELNLRQAYWDALDGRSFDEWYEQSFKK